MKREKKEEFTNATNAGGTTKEKMSKWTTSPQSSTRSPGFSIGTTTSPDFYPDVKDGNFSVNPATPLNLVEKTMTDAEKYGEAPPMSGVKYDEGKLRYELLPWVAVEGLVKVLTYGAKKYSPDGWRTVPDARTRYTAALLRHLSALSVGQKLDPESGLRHIDHVVANACFLSELEQE